MSMYARALHVENFRNFKDKQLELSCGINILVGHNAVGKTNLVEALQLLTAGTSFRHPVSLDLVRNGAGAAHASLRLEGEGRVLDMELTAQDKRRSFARNGKKVAVSGVRGILPSVLFCPDDLDMVKRSARTRRDALDGFGAQLSSRYASLASSYARVVEQRNSLLKQPYLDEGLLRAWDEPLIAQGAGLMVHRRALLARIAARMDDAYGHVAPSEHFSLAYASTVFGRELFIDEEIPRAQIEASFADRLFAERENERRRGMTLVGPHRDDVAIGVDGRAARSFASQGQQRSLVLSWKIAEVKVACDILGRAPLLLLDDVMSELDERRRSAILDLIEGEVQTVITTTNLGYFEGPVLARAEVFPVGEEHA